MTLDAVTFTPEPTGRVQLARTGSGFWRWDHGERFSIDQGLLALLLQNTRLRNRSLRMDFMHYANGRDDMPIEFLGAAGTIDPADVALLPWTDPRTLEAGFGLFAPSSWTEAGWCAVEAGIDEISPVIEWEYRLPEDMKDPVTGETILAGTLIGPCMTGVSLVDRGFFRMDKVKLYSEGGAMPHASLYQELSMKLTTDQLISILQALKKANIADEIVMQMIGMTEAEQEALAQNPDAPEIPEMAAKATPTPTVPAVLAARVAAPKPAIGTSLSELWKNAKAAQTPATPAGTGNYSEKIASIEERLARIEASHDELMISDLESKGLTVGISDPRKLYKEAPAYFMEQVAKNTQLTGSTSPAAANRPSGLRAIHNNAGLSVEDKFALDVKAYREGQAKNGRKIDQQTAIEEVELAQKQAAKRG